MELNWPERLGAKTFLQRYWQKKPLLFRGAFPDFENPLTPDELGGLALDEDIHSRLILRESDARWHLRPGPFNEEELTSLPPSDWTLLVSDVEKHLDGFNGFLDFFRFIPDWRIDDLMISYAPTGASAGPHLDAYDVFLFQAAGQRRWLIDSGQSIDDTMLPDNDIKILQHFKPTDEWVLEPGDMLYLPPGVPHHGISEDDHCMTWSVGFRAPAHAELITDIAQQIAQSLDQNLRYSDRGLKLSENPGELSASAVEALRQIWLEQTQLNESDFAALLGRTLTQSANNEPMTVEQTQESPDSVTVEDLRREVATGEPIQLYRDPSARMIYTEQPDDATLFVNGDAHGCSIEFAQFITDQLSYDTATLLALLDNDRDISCLESLLSSNTVQAPLD